MMNQNKKTLVGALVAAALAIAVYYGLINQQSATSIQNQANQTLGTTPSSQQVVPPVSSTPAPSAMPPSPH